MFTKKMVYLIKQIRHHFLVMEVLRFSFIQFCPKDTFQVGKQVYKLYKVIEGYSVDSMAIIFNLIIEYDGVFNIKKKYLSCYT